MKLKTLGLFGRKFCIGNVCFPVKAQGKQCSLHGRRGKGRENGEIIRELGALKEGGGCACYQAIFFAVFYFHHANVKILIEIILCQSVR